MRRGARTAGRLLLVVLAIAVSVAGLVWSPAAAAPGSPAGHRSAGRYAPDPVPTAGLRFVSQAQANLRIPQVQHRDRTGDRGGR